MDRVVVLVAIQPPKHDSPRTEFSLTHDIVVLDYDEYTQLGSAMHKPTRQGGQASLAWAEGLFEDMFYG